MAQKFKKIVGRYVCVFKCLLPQNPTNQGSIDSSRPYGRLLGNPKTGGFRELVLAENDFKTCSTVNFATKSGNQLKT